MEMILIGSVTLLASLLTFFSGFGLGTLLMPIVGIFFPLPIAIAITAIVHFLNNTLKFVLLAKHNDINILVKFGIPAVVFSFLGAWCLNYLTALSLSFSYSFLGLPLTITPLKMTIGVLIIFFLFLELNPSISIPSYLKKLWIGGSLSGFFGGISGHQGAFRSLFLSQNNLSKEAFLATGVSIAMLVDISRLSVYTTHWEVALLQWKLILVAILSAFIGTLIGKFYLKKVNMKFIQNIVTWMLGSLALLLIVGVL